MRLYNFEILCCRTWPSSSSSCSSPLLPHSHPRGLSPSWRSQCFARHAPPFSHAYPPTPLSNAPLYRSGSCCAMHPSTRSRQLLSVAYRGLPPRDGHTLGSWVFCMGRWGYSSSSLFKYLLQTYLFLCSPSTCVAVTSSVGNWTCGRTSFSPFLVLVPKSSEKLLTIPPCFVFRIRPCRARLQKEMQEKHAGRIDENDEELQEECSNMRTGRKRIRRERQQQ